MTQSIVLQIGQCGNQIGAQFWASALKEHSSHDSRGLYSDAISSFFRNVDSVDQCNMAVRIPPAKIQQLRARAVLIDMEEGVLNNLLRSNLGELFLSTELIGDVSGAGNNWATGFHFYGERHKDRIVEAVRREAEMCDCLQSFFILHSMGGGTGSGLGTRTLALLAEHFPEVYRFVVPVYPSNDDDVITSPYNTVLAMNQITEHANCVVPVENQALSRLCAASDTAKVDTIRSHVSEGKEKAFNRMNSLVSKVILDITASARFEGTLNVDMNEISMNLVPFPRAHYLLPAIAPLATPKIPQQRHLDAIFSDVLSSSHSLCSADVRKGTFLACAMLVRGNVQVSDIRRNIDKLSEQMNFIHWNKDGWKTGLCNVPPVKQMFSVLALSNNTCIKYTFSELQSRFMKLFQRKAHLHHYLHVDGMELDQVTAASHSLQDQISLYDELENSQPVEFYRPQVI